MHVDKASEAALMKCFSIDRSIESLASTPCYFSVTSITMVSFFISIFASLILAGTVFGQSGCTSFGSDIGSGGTYFFELFSSAPFSFKGGFIGIFHCSSF